MVVKKWSEEFDFVRDILRRVPIWVKLHHLPLNCWGIDALSRIGSLVGIPICADEATSQQSRMDYARMLIEVDITRPLVEEVQVRRVSGHLFTQNVQFEWKPLVCFKCLRLGHICVEEKPKMIQRWVPKEIPKPNEGKPQSTPAMTTLKPPSENELGWIAATKVARRQVQNSASLAQRSSSSLFQRVTQEGGGILSILQE